MRLLLGKGDFSLERSVELVNFVYVQLGPKPSATLSHFANQLQENLDPQTAKLFLLTDASESWDFPGTVLKLSAHQMDLIPLWARFLHYDRFSVANHYWRNTLFRFFVLAELASFPEFDAEVPVIHLESDVQFFPCKHYLHLIEEEIKGTRVVQLNSDLSIGSILVSENASVLRSAMLSLKRVFLESTQWRDDMTLLSVGINRGILQPLSNLRISQSVYLEFDGWPVGQYLFGVDPIHNRGVAQGGYVSKFFPSFLQEGEWTISPGLLAEPCGHDHLIYQDSRYKHYFVNLHVHSKVHLEMPSTNSLFWQRTLLAANKGGEFPVTQHNPSLLYHSNNGSFAARALRKVKRMLGC